MLLIVFWPTSLSKNTIIHERLNGLALIIMKVNDKIRNLNLIDAELKPPHNSCPGLIMKIIVFNLTYVHLMRCGKCIAILRSSHHTIRWWSHLIEIIISNEPYTIFCHTCSWWYIQYNSFNASKLLWIKCFFDLFLVWVGQVE